MYTFFLHLHSGLRWLILLAAVVVWVRSWYGLLTCRNYNKFDKISSVSFVMLMRAQFVAGLLLYFIYSPITSRLTFNMSDPVDRFWAVEHVLLMFFAIGATEMGRSMSKKSDEAKAKFRSQSIFFGISLVLMLAGIPWSRIG